eukprot:3617178-Pyramimonas_sp.AAC.1
MLECAIPFWAACRGGARARQGSSTLGAERPPPLLFALPLPLPLPRPLHVRLHGAQCSMTFGARAC